jgi:Cytidine and deoxycytidylate deaminase zinc-binding region
MLLPLQAYAPYTRCAAGAAVCDMHGGTHRGAYIESAAFNPGLPPLQAAVAAAVRSGLADYEEVSCKDADMLHRSSCDFSFEVCRDAVGEPRDGSAVGSYRLWRSCSWSCRMRRCSSGRRRRCSWIASTHRQC